MIYGYVRVSTCHQKLNRQISNIKELYGDCIIVKEYFTGTTSNRPSWERLMNNVKEGDTIVFDSVSRMSRNSIEGFSDYKNLYSRGINLIFLNEPLINTSVFEETKKKMLNIDISTGNEAIDNYFTGNIDLINNLLMALGEEQIKKAFDQSEKEVSDLHKRISEGIRESKLSGTKIGLTKGTKLTTKKSLKCKESILKYSKDFNGSLEDNDVMVLCGGIARNSYYKYKKELKSIEMNGN